ncbi:MAG: hypothetical protein LC792_18555, partial [Actinobacteria bacterium]|nr:hypothetical protein [Actinomycetota bacterium]
LQHAGAMVGASERYNIGSRGSPGPILTFNAITFSTSDSARAFLRDLRAITPGLKMTGHAELSIGVAPIAIDRFMPQLPAGAPPVEVVAAPAVYRAGTIFVEVAGPPGTVADAQVLDLLKLQDKKVQGE